MSEFQFVAFRAIDRPVSKKDLEFMRKQSSRAEITPWSFENEYHYGDFRGNAEEMLLRGYDIHLHYANFGIRKLLIRLPGGLPNLKIAKPYLVKGRFEFRKDDRAAAGILTVEPAYEPGDLEELFDLEGMLDGLAPLRAEIMEGDLRPLYLMHLAVARGMDHDPETTFEAPVPAGLNKLTPAQKVLAELYGLNEPLIAAAAQASPALSKKAAPAMVVTDWVRVQPEAQKTAWLVRLLDDEPSAIRAEILLEYRQSQGAADWPTAPASRTTAQLDALSTRLAASKRRESEARTAAERTARLAKMASDPKSYLLETERLVRDRARHSYIRISEILAELRDALTDSPQANLAEKQAQKLRDDNPTLRVVVSELRRRGFLKRSR